MKNESIICWWSGGVKSAVSCLLAIELFGKENCRIIFIDTCNEHIDTYRFFIDCQVLFGKEIEIITGIKDYKHKLKAYNKIFVDRSKYYQPNPNLHYYSIADVWKYYNSLNVSYGAICSTDLKRVVREKWQLENEYKNQVFGFEFTKKEFNRALSLSLNHEQAKPIFPLLLKGYDKKECIEILNNLGVDIPQYYKDGFKSCINQFYKLDQFVILEKLKDRFRTREQIHNDLAMSDARRGINEEESKEVRTRDKYEQFIKDLKEINS